MTAPAANFSELALKSATVSQADLRFRSLLPKTDWRRLPMAVRRRFSKRLGAGQSAVYSGRVVETRMHFMGWLLAQFLRLIGAPLPVDTRNRGAAAVVTVTESPRNQGQFWTRQYNRANGFPQVIHSTKSFAGPTGLEECVGQGVGMTLRLEVKDEALCFISDRYFCDIFGWRWWIPSWLEPGQLRVEHRDLGAGKFEFGLYLQHRLFGTLLLQRADFVDMKEC